MVKFGTSGWRGIIADDFTYDNVRLVTQAIAEYVKKEYAGNQSFNRSIIIGYDTRFMSEDFAKTSAQVFSGNGIKTMFCNGPTPTPVISFEILRTRCAGAINFTASHNPASYNGIKFSPSWGGPALPETTDAIEYLCSTIKNDQIKILDFSQAQKKKLIKEIDPKKQYFKHIKNLVNFSAIRKANLKIATDLLYGTSIGYLDELLNQAGTRQIVINNWRDVMFGGHPPEPSKENIKDLYGIMRTKSCHLGLSADGDADRFGILDRDGTFINPNQTIALLLYHLLKTRKWQGVVARSVMTTHLIDKIANKFGVEVEETPVGFKFIGEIMVKNSSDFIIGGEESGGLTIRGNVPEKDGIIACLLIAEMIAMSKKSIKAILEEIKNLVGPVYSDRINYRLSKEEIKDLQMKLDGNQIKEFSGLKVKNIVKLDGYKFILSDDSWLGIRLSGTEPVVRLYIETDSLSKMKKLIAEGNKFIKLS